MSETIHDAVRTAIAQIKAQHGGTLPDGLEIRHTSSAPYTVGLWCQQCDGYVSQRTTLEPDFAYITAMVAADSHQHPCWHPKPTPAATEATEAPAGTEGTEARDRLIASLRRDGDGHTGMGAVRLVEAFAHELAEKQRRAVGSSEREGHSMTSDEIIDLIDPKKAQS